MTTRRGRAAVLSLACVAMALAVPIGVRTDDPVSSSVRFTGEIVRIFDRKCQPCHAAGGLAMPLSSYRDVRAWGRAIREEIVEQRMPPWTAARGYGRFRNDLSLSARETITVLSWIDGGMPRGDDTDLPPAKASPAPTTPGARIALPPQRVPALDNVVIRRVAVAIPEADAGRPIARVALIPGARHVLRGAHVEAMTEGGATQWLGAWLPWQRDSAPPEGHGFRVRRGAQLTVELHYRGADREVVDTPALALYYATPQSGAVEELTVPAGTTRLSSRASVWAIVPSPGGAAQSFQVTARRPDGSTEILLWIPHLRREWPQALLPEEAVQLPAGTTVTLDTHPADPRASVRLSLLR